MGNEFFFDSHVQASELAAELTQRALIDTRNRAGMLLEALPVGVLIHTRQGILYANEEASRLFGLSGQQLVGHHVLDFVAPGDLTLTTNLMERTFATEGGYQRLEIGIQPGNEWLHVVRMIAGRLEWEGNPVIQITLQDITELKRVETSLRRLTITDELTGAYNRRHAFYEASLYLERTIEPRIPLSVALFDVDHFKAVNDAYGHGTGDVVLTTLVEVATAVLKALSRSDAAIFCRIGGEEFIALLPNIGLAEAVTIANRLRLAIKSREIRASPKPFRVTVSAGVGEFMAEDVNFDGLLLRCDRALYDAKTLGRNCVLQAV